MATGPSGRVAELQEAHLFLPGAVGLAAEVVQVAPGGRGVAVAEEFADVAEVGAQLLLEHGGRVAQDVDVQAAGSRPALRAYFLRRRLAWAAERGRLGFQAAASTLGRRAALLLRGVKM